MHNDPSNKKAKPAQPIHSALEEGILFEQDALSKEELIPMLINEESLSNSKGDSDPLLTESDLNCWYRLPDGRRWGYDLEELKYSIEDNNPRDTDSARESKGGNIK